MNLKQTLIEKKEAGKKKKEVKKQICDWCCGGSKLNCGTGHFRDLDSDLSYGINVCGGCGGLGGIIESEDFKTRTRRIMDLRFEYCPLDCFNYSYPYPIPPAVIRLQKLEALIHEVTELFNIYGRESDKCFAKSIAEGALQELADSIRVERDEMVKIFTNTKKKSQPEAEACRPAWIAAYKGNLDEANKLFQKVTEQYPSSSIVAHDYGVYLVNFHRSYKDARPWFEKSIQLEPKIAVHFYQAANCLLALKLPAGANRVLSNALNCPDLDGELVEKIKALKAEADIEAAAH